MMDFREGPGDIIQQVRMGKVFLITKAGKPVAVLSPLPGEQLVTLINSKGGYALFAGCASGRNLKATFGPALCSRITWEEASREVTGNPKFCPPADPVHIATALKDYAPDIVICFGRIAGDAVAPLWKGKLILAPHPTARQPDTFAKLRHAAAELAELL